MNEARTYLNSTIVDKEIYLMDLNKDGMIEPFEFDNSLPKY